MSERTAIALMALLFALSMIVIGGLMAASVIHAMSTVCPS